ncbi:MAG: PLP-dependent decarboxylase [Pseudomonadota bacterium]
MPYHNWTQHIDKIKALTTDHEMSFFYYDLDAFQQHLQQLKTWPVKLWYALKANPLSRVIHTVNQAGLNFDVSSVGELKQVLTQGIDPQCILYTGPAKTLKQLRYFLQMGVRFFVVESPQQLRDLNSEAIAQQIACVQVLLRVQLTWETTDKNILGGCAVSAFGLESAEWKKLCLADYPAINVTGIHCFQWGNIISTEKLLKIWQHIATQANQLAKCMAFTLKVIDLGGGLGIPYDQQTEPLSYQQINDCLMTLKQQYTNIEFWLELGRYAIGPFGLYATTVVDRKKMQHKNLLILQGGINHILRPVLTGEAFPCELLRQSNVEQQSFQCHGPLCTSLDKVSEVHLPGDIAIGDWLLFKQVGAYGFTESMPWFLCHDLAGEVVCENGEVTIIRAAAGAESWLR